MPNVSSEHAFQPLMRQGARKAFSRVMDLHIQYGQLKPGTLALAPRAAGSMSPHPLTFQEPGAVVRVVEPEARVAKPLVDAGP
jgi:hypothetical protein